MSSIYLVRHAQASFGADDYDQLSEKGHEQARILGAVLRERIPQRALVFTGSQRRHKETAAGCLEAMGEASSPMHELRGFDEFDHNELLARLDPRYADRAQLVADIMAGDDPRKTFHQIFTRAVARWTSRAHDAEYTEPWPEFRRRVRAALDEVTTSLQPHQNALIFTSGGPISAICEELLHLPDSEAFRISWLLVNCSVTKLLLRRSGLSLSTLNEHAHFEGKQSEYLTYR